MALFRFRGNLLDWIFGIFAFASTLWVTHSDNALNQWVFPDGNHKLKGNLRFDLVALIIILGVLGVVALIDRVKRK